MTLRSLVSLLFWNLVVVLLWGYLIFDHPHRLIFFVCFLVGQVVLNFVIAGVMKRFRISGVTLFLLVMLLAMAFKVLNGDDIYESALLLVPFALLIWSLRADRADASRKIK